MFENLQDKLQGVFRRLSSRGRLGEADVDAALREVRLALLEADVNFKVVKDFIGRVRERAVGVEVTRSLTPAQQVIKIVNEELIATLGEPARLDLDGPSPHVIMLVGLQGSGKTTAASKLALFLRKSNHRPLLVAADTRRRLPSSKSWAIRSTSRCMPKGPMCRRRRFAPMPSSWRAREHTTSLSSTRRVACTLTTR